MNSGGLLDAGSDEAWAARAAADPRDAMLGQAIRWAEALQKAGAHNREAVADSVQRWNKAIRDALRSETRLTLGGADDRVIVSIRVVDGLPVSLEEALSAFEGREWLLLNRRTLEECQHGATFVTANLQQINDAIISASATAHPLGRQESPREVAALAADALAVINADENLKRVFEIDGDVLGAYFFKRKEIHIYWMAVSIIGLALGISIEGLAAVVLAHELAHAYMHLGQDIDEDDWPTDAMGKTSLHIVEGLAQFYTGAVCTRLEARCPAAQQAYTTLLSKQTGPYRAHLSWSGENERSGEALRATALAVRKVPIATYDDFKTALNEHRGRMKLKPLTWPPSTPKSS